MSRFGMLLPAVPLLALLSTSAVAQDGFGGAVAVGDGEVMILKPAAGQGPATVYVYRWDGAGWQIEQMLHPSGGRETGEGLSASIAIVDGALLVGSGDPRVAWGAHVFQRGTGGAWVPADRLPLSGDGGTQQRVAVLDLPSLMRIMQPPQRVVAAHGDRLVVAAVGGPAHARGARVYEREPGTQRWSEQARLEVDEVRATDRFGAALAAHGDRVVVGAPGHGPSGAAFLFQRDAVSGAWKHETTLSSPDSSANTDFGSAVALGDDALLVGRPGAGETPGAVLVFRRDEVTGQWRELDRLTAAVPTAGDGFGTAITLVGRILWVGAPGADAARGRLHVFESGGAAGWVRVEGFTAVGPTPGARLGTSIAATSTRLIAGAPGGGGQAAIFELSGAAASGSPAWLGLDNTLAPVAGGEVRCEEGRAGRFECSEVDLKAFIPLAGLGAGPGERISDVWGWTDRETGREYALAGLTRGMALIDITDPTSPRYLGIMPANPSGARDIKVYRDHAFLTGDGAGQHGLLVFDLTRLRDAAADPGTFEPDAVYDGIASAHNLVIDTDAGFAYPVGASGGGTTCGGGLHMVDIRDPVHPSFAGCYTDTEGLIWQGRTHDAQCVVYRGPDDAYRGRQICFASNETALRIVDVTEKENPIAISAARYPGMAYVHQGWLTEDQRYFYLDDELDELVGQTERTKTLVWDVAELDDPLLVGEFLGPDHATDHNLYVKGDRMYQANYQAGLRVIDISDPVNPVEVGHFDTTPYDGNPAGFAGAWTAYPFFESGMVIVSSMNEGLFVLKPRRQALVP